MINRFLIILTATFFSLPSLALAQGSNIPYGHEMMMGSWGWGMILGPIMMIAMIAAVVLIVRWLGCANTSAQTHAYRPERTPIDILNERFAKGEIDKDEYEERRRVLENFDKNS